MLLCLLNVLCAAVLVHDIKLFVLASLTILITTGFTGFELDAEFHYSYLVFKDRNFDFVP